MRTRLVLLYIFLSLWMSHAQQSLKIAVCSDVHYLSPELANEGEALSAFEQAVGRYTRDMHAVLDTVVARIGREKPDVLLIPGDLTNNGEKASHRDLIAKLQSLRRAGTRIFVVPGNHDVNVPNAKKYIGLERMPTSSVSADEFAELYADFGYAQAFRRDTASLSYVAALNDSVWLLGIDSNRYREHTTTTISAGRILPRTLDWVLEVLREAKTKNILVLGMMHHGLVEHLPYQATFFPAYIINDWRATAEMLADAGLKIIFTGHFHANDVTAFTSVKGNTLYDVETGSLIAYPFPYRIMRLDNYQIEITSHFVKSIDDVPDLHEKYRAILYERSRRLARSKLKNTGMPLPDETLTALSELLAKMAVLHAAGDEQPDEEIQQMIRAFADMMHVDETDDAFQLDFPPADNNLTIDLND